MIRIAGMGGSPLTYLKYVTYLERFSSQIITSKVPSTSGRALRCILEVSIDKVHTKVRKGRALGNLVQIVCLPRHFAVLRRPKLYLPALLARFPRDITTRHYLRWVSARKRRKKKDAAGILGLPPFGNDVSLVTHATVFSVISLQSEILQLTTMTKYVFKAPGMIQIFKSKVVRKQKLIKMRKKTDSWTELNFNANINYTPFLKYLIKVAIFFMHCIKLYIFVVFADRVFKYLDI